MIEAVCEKYLNETLTIKGRNTMDTLTTLQTIDCRLAGEAAPLVIETRGLSKSYKGVQALQTLDLKVSQNSICGFLGPNGAGKTTTIKLLLGLARPTTGSGKVFGLDIERENDAIRRRVGYLSQDPRFFEYMTARQVLSFTAGFFYQGPKQAIDDRVAETLDLVGLSDKADRPVKGFSGGERQRLGIAQAEVNYPDLLILDEPAASLDPQGRHDVLEVMARLRQYTTIFYSTHILEDVQRVSDTVIILNHGRLVAQGSIEEVLGWGQAATSAGIGLAIGAIVMMQDSILSERHSGTTAWVLSKPLHRPAYILAKVVAYAFAFLLTGPVFSGALLYLQLNLHGLDGMVPLGFVEAMGLEYLNQLFYMTLALMLATLFDTRGPVLGISLGLTLAGLLVGFSTSTALTRLLAEILPWQFTIPFGANSPLAGYLAFGEPLPTVVPVIATVLWCLIFVGVALWRIGREEF